MEDMDIDLVVDIPDTPDRLSTRQMKRGDSVDKESNFSAAGHSRGSSIVGEESLDQMRGKGKVATENGHIRKQYSHLRRHSGIFDEIESKKNTIDLSSPGNAPLFRRTGMERSKNSIREPYMEKGKAPCSKLPSKSSGSRQDHAIVDLTEQSMHNGMLNKACEQGRLNNSLVEGRRECQVPRTGGSFLRNASNSSETSINNCKGKEKVDGVGFKVVGSFTDHGKGVDLSNCSPFSMEKQLPASHRSIASPRAIGQKRLVRNGCISPQNIAIRAKQLNEQSQDSSEAEQNSQNVVRDGPGVIDISEIIAEDNYHGKGKGIVHPHTSKEHDRNFINLSSGSSPIINNEEASGIGGSSRDACFEGKGGWRRTHSSSNKNHAGPFSNRVVKRDNSSGKNNRIGCDSSDSQGATETAPVIVSKFNQISVPSQATNILPKRQRRHVLTTRNSGESSRVVPAKSDIEFLGSSRESSSSRSSYVQLGQDLHVLDLDDSFEMRGTNANMMGVNDEDSEARARQVEADEMLARELQEQLYHEAQTFGDDEIDENIAWALQQEEEARREPNHRSSTRHSRNQPPLRIQNSSNRRGGQARLPTSARMSRLRSRVLYQPRAGPSRTRNFRFPLDMDLDMRLDILEALEAAIGDADDMGMANNILEVQRDFNENDYEMLLSLDENNHQHGGASTNQINSLPLSKVQTENFEDCAICLDTPAIGETIRHLPCLHKFHKDCIDPWLSRKTSCPVCKSSIT